VVIAGGGPAGSSLAIRLANAGREVVLVEREAFPRNKLCGEFISPECLRHFGDLGVLKPMLGAGGDRIRRTVFYGMRGSSIEIDSGLFGGEALSLSRYAMDKILIERARQAGVTVLESSVVNHVEIDDSGKVAGAAVRTGSSSLELETSILVDATGRSRSISKLAGRARGRGREQASRGGERRQKFVGYKAHLHGADVPAGTCEIYSFRGGYSGLSNIEGGAANHCFLVDAGVVKQYAGDADRIVASTVMKNPRAAASLRSADRSSEWLAVSVDNFGVNQPVTPEGIFAVGDASAFIDPFTGSGMLMALESSEILASSLLADADSVFSPAMRYRRLYREKFTRRLLICGLLRRTAFMPWSAETMIRLLSWSRPLSSAIARATRPSRNP